MKQGFVISIFFFLFSFSTKAQSESDSTKHFIADSNIIQDKRVHELISKHIQINEARKKTISGYRVQIHFGTEKLKALDVKSKFISQYNNIPAYLDYQQPYFKIRIGNFRTKPEAYKLLQEILIEWPGAFIVSDDIEWPEL